MSEPDNSTTTLSDIPLETVVESTQQDSAADSPAEASAENGNSPQNGSQDEESSKAINVQFDNKMNLFYSAKVSKKQLLVCTQPSICYG